MVESGHRERIGLPPLPQAGGAARLGSLLPSRSGVGKADSAGASLRLAPTPQPLPPAGGEIGRRI